MKKDKEVEFKEIKINKHKRSLYWTGIDNDKKPLQNALTIYIYTKEWTKSWK